EKPAEKSQTTNNEENSQQESGQFHNETVAQSEEPYSVFQDFTELTNLRRAHGAFFARCGEIIIDALFKFPLQQLNALFHAHFFLTAPARLVKFVQLNKPPHNTA